MGVPEGYCKKWLAAYKTRTISETTEDRANVTINGLYEVVYEVSNAAKMYDLE